MALSDTKLRSLHGKPYSGPQEVSDADGLSAQFSPNGVIRFQCRCRWEVKAQRLSLGRYALIIQSKEGAEHSEGGVVDIQQFNPESVILLFGGSGGSGGAVAVTAFNNAVANQIIRFQNNGTGNVTITNGGNIRCKGGVNADNQLFFY